MEKFMNNKIHSRWKSALSVMSIALFLAIALSSGKPDDATNTVIPIDNSLCMVKPTVNSPATAHIIFKDKKTGAPLAFFKGEIFFTIQQVTLPECRYDRVIKSNHSFTTDAAGVYTYTSDAIEMKNAADGFRMQVRLDETAVYNGDMSRVDFRYYPSLSFGSFTLYGLKKDDL